MPSFRDILFTARQRTIRDLTPAMEAAFYAAYLSALERAVTGIRPDDMSESGVAEFTRRLVIAFRAYGIQSERIAKEYAIRAILEARNAHRDALEDMARSLARQVSGAFDGVPREAYENLFIRRAMGLTDSYRSLDRGQIKRIGQTIETGIERMVLDGESWQKAAGRIVKGLINGDPAIKAAARQFVNKSRGVKPWVRIDGDPSEDAIKAARQIGYSARMIARTEPAHAFHEGDRTSSQRNPLVRGMKWNLSPRHPEPDICDVYAEVDFHGMGPGVYPPEFLPPLPHPHDLCFMTHELRRPGEWQRPKDDPTDPVLLTSSQVAAIIPGATDNAILRTMQQVNGTTLRMIDGRRGGARAA